MGKDTVRIRRLPREVHLARDVKAEPVKAKGK